MSQQAAQAAAKAIFMAHKEVTAGAVLRMIETAGKTKGCGVYSLLFYIKWNCDPTVWETACAAIDEYEPALSGFAEQLKREREFMRAVFAA